MKMDKARIYVDFNEMVTGSIVLLSKEDMKTDSEGNQVAFYEGMPIGIYSDNEEDGKPNNLIADGIAVKYDLSDYTYWSHVKWCCMIDEKGILHESDLNQCAESMQIKADVEAFFEFNGTRKNAAFEGYRPAHLVKDDYLTTGMHHYYGVNEVAPDGRAYGTITFISPEYYPNCLWIGKKISIQEGARVVGQATITKIYNPVLDSGSKQDSD